MEGRGRETHAETGEEMSPSSSRYLYRVLMTLSRRSTLRLCTILRARVSHAMAARTYQPDVSRKSVGLTSTQIFIIISS